MLARAAQTHAASLVLLSPFLFVFKRKAEAVRVLAGAGGPKDTRVALRFWSCRECAGLGCGWGCNLAAQRKAGWTRLVLAAPPHIGSSAHARLLVYARASRAKLAERARIVLLRCRAQDGACFRVAGACRIRRKAKARADNRWQGCGKRGAGRVMAVELN